MVSYVVSERIYYLLESRKNHLNDQRIIRVFCILYINIFLSNRLHCSEKWPGKTDVTYE